MIIDWSKAPEGATRYHPETSKVIEHWLKLVDDEVWIWTSVGKRWMPNLDAVEDGQYHDRPVQWIGEGLPPVGIVCEALVTFGRPNERVWRQVNVTFLKPDSGEALVFDVVTFRPGWADEFRPIRTPEQIAAEEREKVISEMLAACPYPGSPVSRADCKHLYDAGYRKVEGGAA